LVYLIKRGGRSVSPVIIKDHIDKLSGVLNSAVVGVPHHLYGEMIWAFIVKGNENKNSEVGLKDVMKHCRNLSPNYMVPDQVMFVDEIPKYPGVEKVDFNKLIQLAEQN